MSVIISCKNVTMQYENTVAVQDVSFDVEKGSFVCIIGENGAGKSTLIKGITGICSLSSGTIDISTKKVFGYMPQNTVISNDFPASVLEICKSGCLCKKLLPIYTKEDKKTVDRYISMLSLDSIKNINFSELSGGQKQKVLLCRALCTKSELLVLDEPSSGLDASSSIELYKILKEINLKYGVTVLMISHDLSSSLEYSSHILQLNKQMMFYGKTEDFKKLCN